MEITENLKDWLEYDGATGVFTWKKVAKNAIYSVGDRAGVFNNEGSLSVTISGRNYLLHKVANYFLNGDYNVKVLHKNGIRSDNRECNLDIAYPAIKGEVSQELLRKYFLYDEVTGIVTRRIATKIPSNVGTTVGTINSRGYVQVNLSKNYLLHRLIFLYMVGSIPDTIDHIDGNPSNNAWNNLRACTVSQNAFNKVSNINKLGIKGIKSYDKGFGYVGVISKDGKTYRKGSSSLEEVVDWLKSTRKELHGEFANHGITAVPKNNL